MPDFYYQIKTKDKSNNAFSTWAFPPLFSGKVTADNKKKAKQLIDEEYQQKFPLRVLQKDIDEHDYLLRLEEIKENDTRTKSLFEFRMCKQCGNEFRRIDLYNDHNEKYKGMDFCSYTCKEEHRQENWVNKSLDAFNPNPRPVIYKITNTNTGMSYVGKTTQPFTLRWYQHFFQSGSCKFHQAIQESKIEDWQFSVLESIPVTKDIDLDAVLTEREKYWIDEFNTINAGYNTANIVQPVKRLAEEQQTKLEFA